MLMSNYIEELFELKGAILENIKSTEESLNIFISMKKEPHTCPCCNFPTERVHDYRTQIIKDVPFLHKATFIHLRKRRYVCPHCGKRFLRKYLSYLNIKEQPIGSGLLFYLDLLKFLH